MKSSIKKVLAALLVVLVVLSAVILPMSKEEVVEATSKSTSAVTKNPKYVFLFIGDGMAHVQVNAAQVFKGCSEVGNIRLGKINFTEFPITGVATTQDSTSFCPDSASTATSIAGGVKTHSGVIGLTQDKKASVETIAETAKKRGMKVGIVSSVTLNHATPAAFYANVESRNNYYEIGKQMADSGFDYFAGGSLGKRTGKGDEKDLYDIMREKGYKVTENKADFLNINNKTGKVYAVAPRLQDSGSMPYSVDQNSNDVTLRDFVKKGIEVLNNDKGFFMMVESGKIDWACHANDAVTTIKEVIGFEDAIQEAIDFYNKHPEDTLILVTGDHETGGMTVGQAATGYETAFEMMKNQKMSYVEMDKLIKDKLKNNPDIKFKDILADLNKWTGLIFPADGGKSDGKFAFKDHSQMNLVLTAYEMDLLEKAFEQTKTNFASEKKPADLSGQEKYNLYGGYEPLSVTLTHLLNNKSGIGWTSYSHTGVPVAVYAIGQTSELYGGFYDNTDIYHTMMKSYGFR